jgi:exoribonuclease II
MNDELNDPIRVFENNPKKAAYLLVKRQLELVQAITENHKTLDGFIKDRRLLESLPTSIVSDPIKLATIIASFSKTSDIISNYQLAIVAFATLTCSDEQLRELFALPLV